MSQKMVKVFSWTIWTEKYTFLLERLQRQDSSINVNAAALSYSSHIPSKQV